MNKKYPWTDLAAAFHTSVVDDLTDLVSPAVSTVLTPHSGAAPSLVGVALVLGQTATH